MTPGLNYKQEEHLWHLIIEFQKIIVPKYRVGAAEHGGTLMEKSVEWLLIEALKENIDQFTYLTTALDNYRKEAEAKLPEEAIYSAAPLTTGCNAVSPNGHDCILIANHKCSHMDSRNKIW